MTDADGALVLANCVTYAICGFRIYAQQSEPSAPLSNPMQYLLIRDSMPLIAKQNSSGQTCSEFPPQRCPNKTMGNYDVKNWTNEVTLRGAAYGQEFLPIARECVTYSLCGHRIYYASGQPIQLPITPLQYIEARASLPAPKSSNSPASACAESDFPTATNCSAMHLYVSQQVWREPQLAAVVTTADGPSGMYNCVTRSICFYANPPPGQY